ncbi:hypothetical protein ADINL_2511 [Nitrincola lacisaponensis]|uniref:Uncharacterized protein n=1 Tax=Nitrincola lacisaponensis TaxID=267850 RepID=A0A063Y4B4_9GAMM|nr:hypothetical protein [Nitrincola lacisaponensis]KDE39382.1 hypothetical protein ADINL_2511 [Nitrincola lacisaponensis]
MTRIKKQRRAANLIVLDKTPKKKERLADPESYESRKQQALKKRKKKLSLYEKARQEAEQQARNDAAGRRGSQKLGPLADKILRMNAEKKKAEATSDAEA